MVALGFMKRFLANRPRTFSSIQKAIDWSLSSGSLRNVVSARISMPDQIVVAQSSGTQKLLKEFKEGVTLKLPATLTEVDEDTYNDDANDVTAPPTISPMQNTPTSLTPEPAFKYTWKVDLESSEPHWIGWFTGITAKFIALPVPKLLLLSGMERLDKDLTIAQMQGKFQLQVFTGSGHSIHEDAPEKVADSVFNFLHRMRIVTPV